VAGLLALILALLAFQRTSRKPASPAASAPVSAEKVPAAKG
jgi:hypothetical protein